MIDTLRDQAFDAAVVFTVYSQNPLPTAMLLYQAGVPRIAGYCRENPYGLMTDWLPDPEPLSEIRHEVTRQLDLVRAPRRRENIFPCAPGRAWPNGSRGSSGRWASTRNGLSWGCTPA